MPEANEAALRAAEGALRSRIVSITHEIGYLLQARDIWAKEHDKMLTELEDRTSMGGSESL